MSIIILVIPPMSSPLVTRYINFMLILTGWSRYPSLSSPTFYANCYDFYSFFEFTIRIFRHRSSCSFRSIHIYCRTCCSVSPTSSSNLRLLMSYLRSPCLFLVSMSLFFTGWSLFHCLLIFRYRSFKNIKKYASLIQFAHSL